jgi:Carboxypeptidase regulatory-like domain/TonB dependent receptor
MAVRNGYPRIFGRTCVSMMIGALAMFLLETSLIGTPQASAQAVYGSIFGTVTDNTGAVIPNATVTVTDVSKATSVTAQSNASGDYRVDHLIPDTYSVSAEATSFQKSTVNAVVVYADTAPKVDLTLQAGGVSTTIQVTSAPPVLESDRADVATVLNSRAVETLPNLQRNFTSFELLTPGTTYIGWSVGQSTNPQESQQIEVNGQLPFATGYELDGTDNQEPIQGVAVINPNLDAVSEMKVTSQNYDAEFGKAVGGLVTAQTKSGSNSLHGAIFDYRRSDYTQARDPFTQIGSNSIPSFLHNQFGGSIGGPIKKDKIFFFGDYQGLRERTGTTILTTVPTATAHTTCTSGGTCDLSDYLNPALGGGPIYQAYDPESNPIGTAGRTAFAGNLIPAGRLSGPAVKLISDMPMPNFGNGSIFDNYTGSGSGGFNTNQFDVRIDGQISQTFHTFGRYTRFDSSLTGAPIFGAAGGPGFGLDNIAGTDSAVDQSIAAGGDYAVSSRWLTDFRFGWFRVYLNDQGPGYNQPLGTNLGIPGVNQGNINLTGGLPQFQVAVPSNGANGSSNVTYGTTTNEYVQTESQFQGVNNWTHVMGNHNVKFGADIRFALNHLVGVNNNDLLSGQFEFPASVTAGPTTQGLGYATFLLGDVGSFFRTEIQNTNAAERQKRMFFYAQDQWRATHNLTLSYGLRWELYFPEYVAGKGEGGLLDLNTGDVRIAGYGGYGDNLNVAMQYTHLAPRIGIAWQVRPSTVVRAGYGRVYGMGWSGDTFGEVLTFSYPTAVTQNLNAPNINYYALGLSAGPPVYNFAPIPANGNYPLPNGIQQPTRPLTMRIPTLDAWNFTIQQELSSSASLQIGYIGSHGIHNMFDSSNQANPNQQTIAGFDCVASGAPLGCNEPIDPATGAPYTLDEREPYFDGTAQKYLGVTFGAPFGWTQSLRYNANEATTSYNALQVVLQKRFDHGFQLLSHYTWSHALAHESDYFFMDPRADYGNSYYNRRNVFVTAGNWDLPFGRNMALGANSHGVLNQIIGGFSLNGTLTWEGGLPFTPYYSLCNEDQDIDGVGGTMCRPSLVPGASVRVGAGSFNPITHSVSYFAPVPTLAFAGQVQGPFERPYPGTFGDLGRDSLWGPSLFNTDLAITKKFFIRESVNLQFMVQAFNVFNHPNLGQPSGCVDCGSSSGLITDIVASQDGTTMRRLQFAARLQF